MLLEVLLGGVHELEGSELVTLSLETLDNFTNETTLDACIEQKVKECEWEESSRAVLS
jgi:hypothetical protein